MTTKQTPEQTGAMILVVDDEEAVASVLARGLRYAGYRTTIAHSGSDALAKLAIHQFDALLTDINMPKMRGDELQRIARERDPHLATLLITAADDTACAVECLKGGALDYLLKPFDISDVITRVGKALERRQTARDGENYRKNLETRVQAQTGQIKHTIQGSLESLIHALEAKDPSTRNHSSRVADLSYAIACRVKPDDLDFASRVRVAALFHDLGKIGVPEAILHKTGPLNEEEKDMVRKHPVIGADILAPLLDGEIVAMVRGHHEHVDGAGYPDHLSGEGIPYGARIISVADAYDAMTTIRPYHAALSRHDVLQHLLSGTGRQWDYAVVQALCALAKDGKLAETPPPSTKDEEIASLAADLSESGTPVWKPQESVRVVVPAPPVAPAAPPEAGENKPAPVPPASGENPPAILNVRGFVDADAIAVLRDSMNTSLRKGQMRIVVDLHEASAITTDNAQSLYALGLLARRAGGSLTLRGVPTLLKAVFETAGLARLFRME